LVPKCKSAQMLLRLVRVAETKYMMMSFRGNDLAYDSCLSSLIKPPVSIRGGGYVGSGVMSGTQIRRGIYFSTRYRLEYPE